MGERSGTEGAPPGRARALWLKIWGSRTKIVGYAGVIAGSVQLGIAGGQHWQTLLLGALVAAIGHYNDAHQGQT
jgi:hypothetical protein